MSLSALGVDGGGTRTRALLVDEAGAVISRSEGPASLIDPANPSGITRVLRSVAEAAAGGGGRTLPLAALWAGLAGAGRPGVRDSAETALAEAGIAERVRVGTDSEAAFHDAFGEGPGILLIMGTGSSCLARGVDGSMIRVGGWGGFLGDEGSGYAVSQGALRAVCRAEDGRGIRTALTTALLRALHLGEPAGLVSWAWEASKADVSGLAPVVVECAAQGDAVARGIVDGAVQEAVRHTDVARERLGAAAPGRIALVGGLVASGRPLRPAVAKALGDQGLEVMQAPVIPERGAAHLALALACES